MHFYKYLFFVLLLLFFSCKKETTEEAIAPVDRFTNGLLIINEGLFQQNNANLSWANLSDNTINNEIFEQKTSRQLGDVANDIIRYGSKLYIVVSVSSTVEVLDAETGNPIQQINMIEGGVAKQPRFAVASNGRVFVSCFDGFVDVIDTTSLNLVQRIQVGANPDGMHLQNNRIYVANSGGLSYPHVDSTLSVIDAQSLTEVSKIVVGKNPTRVTSDSQGNIYAITQTGLNSLNNQLVKINEQTQTIDTVYNWNVMRFTKMNQHLVLNILQGNTSTIQLFDTNSGTISNSNFIPSSTFTTYYGAQYDQASNQLYCFDAMSYVYAGFVRVFSGSGTFIKNIQVGLNPSKLIIYE